MAFYHGFLADMIGVNVPSPLLRGASDEEEDFKPPVRLDDTPSASPPGDNAENKSPSSLTLATQDDDSMPPPPLPVAVHFDPSTGSPPKYEIMERRKPKKAPPPTPAKTLHIQPSQPSYDSPRSPLKKKQKFKAVTRYVPILDPLCPDQVSAANGMCLRCLLKPCAIEYYDLEEQFIDTLLTCQVNHLDDKETRYEMYRLAAREIYGPLGEKVRMKLPDCVVSRIRKLSPSPDGEYVGFKESV
jgi:hypothetical protein